MAISSTSSYSNINLATVSPSSVFYQANLGTWLEYNQPSWLPPLAPMPPEPTVVTPPAVSVAPAAEEDRQTAIETAPTVEAAQQADADYLADVDTAAETEQASRDSDITTATETAQQYELVSVENTVVNHHQSTEIATEQWPTIVSCSYQQDSVTGFETFDETVDAPPLTFDVVPYNNDPIVPGSLVATIGDNIVIYDSNGTLYANRDAATGVGTQCGTINYGTGEATISVYPQIINPAVQVEGVLTRQQGFLMDSYVFRTPGAPVRDGSLSVRGTSLAGDYMNATAANNGTIKGAGNSLVPGIDGAIDTTTGVVRLDFGRWVPAAGNESQPWYDPARVQEGVIWEPVGVLPETALYNCVVYSFLPLDADLLGIEPIRLPIDGRVPVFKSGNVAVVHHTDDELLPNPIVEDTTYTLGRGQLALCDIRDQDGTLIPESLYSLDLAAGTVTFHAPLDLTAYTQPLVAAHRIEDMVLISEAQINGLIRTVGPITHSYPANETQVSSALIFGDLAARIVRQFTQKTWDNVWRDARSGDDTTAKYNDLTYPLVLTNKGSIAQRWCIKFTGSTTFQVISEKMGVIAEGNTSSDVAPINPATGVPYFTIDYRGWGSGWASGNCLRFDTSAANAPLWIARTTMQGAVEEPTDEFVIQIRGDAN